LPPTRAEFTTGVEAISAAEAGGYGEPHRQDTIIPYAAAALQAGVLLAETGGILMGRFMPTPGPGRPIVRRRLAGARLAGQR
jgi:hypothetical protein